VRWPVQYALMLRRAAPAALTAADSVLSPASDVYAPCQPTT